MPTTDFLNSAGGGNFYLKVNGIDFLVRGADYEPDLLFKYDEDREATILRYVKDMGLNLLRWESKISSEHIIELADEEGIPVMLGWMCCNQWEKWNQWDAEDHRVARESLRAQIRMLRSHASVFIWASGSDGLPPVEVRKEYHQILMICTGRMRWSIRFRLSTRIQTARTCGTAFACRALQLAAAIVLVQRPLSGTRTAPARSRAITKASRRTRA